jgi:hypothetical protein
MHRPSVMLVCVASLLAAGCSGSARQQPPAATAAAPAKGSLEAVAWLRVRREPGGDQGEYDAYRNTQAVLIKSSNVLNAALRQPGIAGLRTLGEQPDPLGWLARAITVTIPAESEVLQVRLRGDDAQEIQQIVNAVIRVYLDDVVGKEKTERLARRDLLEQKYKENMAEIRTRLETFNALARTLGTRDSVEVATQRSLLLDHLGELRKEIHHQQRDIVAIDADLAAIEATKDVPPAAGQAAPPNPAALRARREVLAKRLETISQEFDDVADEVRSLGNANADLDARRGEIAQLQAVINQLGIQLNASADDLTKPSRVELIEQAQVEDAKVEDAS